MNDDKGLTYCCEHSWREARDAAWNKVRSSRRCLCDPHVEYCDVCFPVEFRPGGAWDRCKPAAASIASAARAGKG